MPLTVEDRLEELERTVHALTGKVEGLARQKPGRNDWLKTFGWAKDDPHFEEAVRLGREYRERDRAKTLKKLDVGS
jgi:hypothetical protein